MEGVPENKLNNVDDNCEDDWLYDAVDPSPGVFAGVKALEHEVEKWPDEHSYKSHGNKIDKKILHGPFWGKD